MELDPLVVCLKCGCTVTAGASECPSCENPLPDVPTPGSVQRFTTSDIDEVGC